MQVRQASRAGQAVAPRVQVLKSGATAAAAKRTQQAASEGTQKKRVAAYCRVSTDHEDQETSFEAQQKHFNSMISEHPGWELVGIYADEESGTRAEKRENFIKMIGDCEAGRIDMILSKSISRWARNTLDSLQYIRKLKAMGIPVVFTKEGINTMDQSGEILVTIMSSLAQQESASISQNVQIGVRYHYQEGKVCSGVHRLLGYNRTPDGSLEIVPEEAEIVQRIFRDYLDGYSPKHIARMLTEEGVDGSKTTASGILMERKWNREGLDYLLQNEKYTGDLLLQKFYTVDFLTKKVARNTGQLPQYYVENSHDPVIPKDIFLQVQAEMARRKHNWRDFRYSMNSPLSGRTFCGNCGCPYRKANSTWRCESKLNKKRHPGVECGMDSIRDEDLRRAVVEAMNRLPGRKEELIRLDERIRWGGLTRADEVLAGIEAQIGEVQEEIRVTEEACDTEAVRAGRARLAELQRSWSEASEQRAVYADKALQVRNLQDRIKVMEKGNDQYAYLLSPMGKCESAENFFRITQPKCGAGKVTAFSDDDMIRYIERIEVFEDRVTVVFKAGITEEIAR